MRIGFNATYLSARHKATTFLGGVLRLLLSLGHEVVVYSSLETYSAIRSATNKLPCPAIGPGGG